MNARNLAGIAAAGIAAGEITGAPTDEPITPLRGRFS